MAKDKYTVPHTHIANHVLEQMAKTKLKPTEYMFLFCLWRNTFGMKNTGRGEAGKWMKWEPSIFIEATGLEKSLVSRLKRELLKKRIVRKRHEEIGFNWHYDQWQLSKQTTVVQTDNSGTNIPLELSKQTTGVVQIDNSTGSKPATDANPQSLNKGNKVNKENSVFLDFWKEFPHRKKRQHKTHVKVRFDKVVKEHGFKPEEILDTLRLFLKSENYKHSVDSAARSPLNDKHEYVPQPMKWLERLVSGDLGITILSENVYEREVKKAEETLERLRKQNGLDKMEEGPDKDRLEDELYEMFQNTLNRIRREHGKAKTE